MSSTQMPKSAYDILAYDKLGAWNIYFLAKFVLYYLEIIDFHALENAIFAIFLLLPAQNLLNTVKQVIAVIAALFLLHHDSYFPPLERLLASGDLLSHFSFAYLLELMGRFLSWQALAMALIGIVIYVYLVKWVRFTSISVLGIAYIAFISFVPQQEQTQVVYNERSTTQNQATQTSAAASSPSAQIAAFYQQQATLKTEFPAQFASTDFDVVMLNICSLGWDDLEQVNLKSHSFFSQFDVLFNNFSSATSYSGPAGIRLLKASCGQTSHGALYQEADKQCYLFDNLSNLGFETDLAMNHNGNFDNFLGMVNSLGKIESPLQSLERTRIAQRSFDGTPIYEDAGVLNQWLKSRLTSNSKRRALYYNSISLHDGNVLVGAQKFSNSIESYGARTEILFSQLTAFFEKLAQSGRNYMVVMVPEHGASLAGDKMQIAGMRDIPSPAILDIPVGVKFIGPKLAANKQQVVSAPSSYLAVSELIARATRQNLFDGKLDLPMLTTDLPRTPMVGENSGTRMQLFNGKPYIQLDDDEWMVYPGY